MSKIKKIIVEKCDPFNQEPKNTTVEYKGTMQRLTYHLTTTERKYLKLAYDYCQENGLESISVNTKSFYFDFENKTGYIKATKKEGWEEMQVTRRSYFKYEI